MSTPTEQNEVSLSLDHARYLVELGEAIDRLEQNPDFKLVIRETYLDKKVINSVSLLAHEQMEDKIDNIHKDLYAYSNLGMFLMQSKATADKVREDLAEYSQMQLDEAEEA